MYPDPHCSVGRSGLPALTLRSFPHDRATRNELPLCLKDYRFRTTPPPSILSAVLGFPVAQVVGLAQQPDGRSSGDRFGLAPAGMVIALEVWPGRRWRGAFARGGN